MGSIKTIAGKSFSNYSGDGGPAIDAELMTPSGLAVDAVGNIYFADGGTRIRKISINSTGVNNVFTDANISMYPNPATNQLFIENNGADVEQINIYNTTGSLVNQTKEPQNGSIDISGLANGVYLAEIKTKEASVRKRWVKM